MKNLLFLSIICLFVGCNMNSQQQKSDSGVEKATVKVKTDEKGHSIEQSNYVERVTRDNETGSMKHLYIISAYSGDVLEYSTVIGKVTSGSKRLSPTSVIGNGNNLPSANNYVILGNERYMTNEVPDEYGTYGTSMPYFYWFDAQNNYHQYYPSGGTYVHISDKPLRIKRSNLSVELIEQTK